MAEPNDNETSLVKEVRSLLTRYEGLAHRIDVVNSVCTNYLLGRQVNEAKSKEKTKLPVTGVANQIAWIIQQWDARLLVRDWTAAYEALDSRLESRITARELQAWDRAWYPHARLTSFFGDLSYARLFLVSGLGEACLDPHGPGGISLRRGWPHHLVLDPIKTDWDLESHETAVDVRAYTVSEAKRDWGAAAEAKGLGPDIFETNTQYADLVTQDAHLGRALFDFQPGAHQSEAKGVLIYKVFLPDETPWGRRVVILRNPSPITKEPGTRVSDWFILEDKPWPYGCLYLKTDCFRHPACAFSRSLVLACIDYQDILNLANQIDLHRLLLSGFRRWAFYENSILNEQEALGNKLDAPMRIRPGTTQFPQPIVTPALSGDPSVMIQRAMEFMKLAASTHDPMLGVPVGRGPESSKAFQLRLDQALGPIQRVAELDYERVSQWRNRVARAACLYWRAGAGSNGPRRWVSFVGTEIGNLRRVTDVTRKTLAGSPTRCHLKRSAFLAKTREEIELSLWAAVVSGNMSYDEFVYQKFQLTGQPSEAGQEEAVRNAELLLAWILNGEVDPWEGILETDDHDLVIRTIEKLFRQRVTLELGPAQLTALQLAKKRCELWRHEARMLGALEEMALSPAGGGSPPAGGQGVPAASSTPAVGAVEAAAG